MSKILPASVRPVDPVDVDTDDITSVALVALDAAEQAIRATRALLLARRRTDSTPGVVYTRDRLPPGCVSWRQVLDLHRAGVLDVLRVGRRVVVAVDAWERYLATRQAAPRTRTKVDAADPWAKFKPRRVA